MVFEIRPAVRENFFLQICLTGPTGGGKTLSALKLAHGLAEGGPIVLIDTEKGKPLRYAKAPDGSNAGDPHIFDFQYGRIDPPYHPDKFVEAMQAAKKRGAAVVIIDSGSHEWSGAGGVYEQAGMIAQRNKRAKPTQTDWIEPKAGHKRFRDWLILVECHIIVCLRAHEKTEQYTYTKNGEQKKGVRSLGWKPICEGEFDYEFDIAAVLTSENPGMVNKWHRKDEELSALFKDGEAISEATGTRLAAWVRGLRENPAKWPAVGEQLPEGLSPSPAPSPQPSHPAGPEGATQEQARDIPGEQQAVAPTQARDDFWQRETYRIALAGKTKELVKAWASEVMHRIKGAPDLACLGILERDNKDDLALVRNASSATADYIEGAFKSAMDARRNAA